MATPPEVAEYLRTTTASLAQQRYRGVGIPYAKLGRRVIYRWADVEAYVKANITTTADRPGAA
ncbi:helix-turn-helix domain-containing protein [Nocardia sp. R16R-3T]